MNEILGKPTGICKGQGRSMHIYNRKINFFSSAIVGGICPIAVGVALSIKHKFKGIKERPHVWCFIGDGGEDTGSFMESVRFGLSRNLPLTFIIEDNDRSVETSKELRWHNYSPVNGRNVIHYNYTATYPHVGIGQHVSM